MQAAVLRQTFAILSGRPKDLILADVLHGTVVAWARKSNKHSQSGHLNQNSIDFEKNGIAGQWHHWIGMEQRGRVEAALNIHDAELACL
jgi:hypothetical protein